MGKILPTWEFSARCQPAENGGKARAGRPQNFCAPRALPVSIAVRYKAASPAGRSLTGRCKRAVLMLKESSVYSMHRRLS